MAGLSILVFGAALAASLWAMWATVRPEAARIVDLLVHGPVAATQAAVPVAVRSGVRDVRMRRVPAPLPQRAAA